MCRRAERSGPTAPRAASSRGGIEPADALDDADDARARWQPNRRISTHQRRGAALTCPDRSEAVAKRPQRQAAIHGRRPSRREKAQLARPVCPRIQRGPPTCVPCQEGRIGAGGSPRNCAVTRRKKRLTSACGLTSAPQQVHICRCLTGKLPVGWAWDRWAESRRHRPGCRRWLGPPARRTPRRGVDLPRKASLVNRNPLSIARSVVSGGPRRPALGAHRIWRRLGKSESEFEFRHREEEGSRSGGIFGGSGRPTAGAGDTWASRRV